MIALVEFIIMQSNTGNTFLQLVAQPYVLLQAAVGGRSKGLSLKNYMALVITFSKNSTNSN